MTTDINLIQQKLKGKIGFVDIENCPAVALLWGPGKQYVGHNQIIDDRRIISIAYMEEGWEKPKYLKWDKNQKDAKMLEKFAKIVQKWDVVIAQNGDRFDFPMLNGRAWINKTTPIKDLVTLDTLKMSRRNMRLSSHSLDFMSKSMGDTGKLKTDFDLWKDVWYGSKTALKRMIEYNIEDVVKLRAVFWDILPYCSTRNMPIRLGMVISSDKNGCPNCGGTNYSIYGTYGTNVGRKNRCFCNDCNSNFNALRL